MAMACGWVAGDGGGAAGEPEHKSMPKLCAVGPGPGLASCVLQPSGFSPGPQSGDAVVRIEGIPRKGDAASRPRGGTACRDGSGAVPVSPVLARTDFSIAAGLRHVGHTVAPKLTALPDSLPAAGSCGPGWRSPITQARRSALPAHLGVTWPGWRSLITRRPAPGRRSRPAPPPRRVLLSKMAAPGALPPQPPPPLPL